MFGLSSCARKQKKLFKSRHVKIAWKWMNNLLCKFIVALFYAVEFSFFFYEWIIHSYFKFHYIFLDISLFQSECFVVNYGNLSADEQLYNFTQFIKFLEIFQRINLQLLISQLHKTSEKKWETSRSIREDEKVMDRRVRKEIYSEIKAIILWVLLKSLNHSQFWIIRAGKLLSRLPRRD